MAFLVTFGTACVVSSTVTPSGADTVLAPTQVFASVGNSTVNVYSPNTAPAAPSFVQSLNDGSTIPASSPVYPGYPGAPDDTTGSAFGPASPASSASPAGTDNFYVTDDYSGQISEYNTSGALVGVFASGLQNPLSLVFDNSGNLYVGQQNTPYIAEYNSSGQAQTPIGPVTTGETGDDWIDLASDQCTFYYTTETNVIYRYANNCANGTNGQQSNFNSIPFNGANAFQVRILPDGGALVADSDAVLRLDDTGTVTQIYPCSASDQTALEAAYAPGGPSNPNPAAPAPTVDAPLPAIDGSGCGGQLFSLAIDPSGTSFWAGDSYSGNIWQIDLATGQALTEINTGAAFLYGLTVYNGYEAAQNPSVVSATPTQLTVAPVTGNFSTPTPVSATLTNATTNAPISGELVTFTLNGNPTESCSIDTNAQGVATCPITATEPSNSYTLSASFAGDTTTSTPLGSNSATSTFTENADTTSVTVASPPSVVNGQPITLSGTLTDTTTNTPLGTEEVTFSIGSTGSSLPPQSCSAITDPTTGMASCTIQSVDQPASSEPINASFTGDAYNNPSTSPPSTVTVTEPTILTVNTATSDYSDQTTVSAVLTDGNTNAPIGNEPVVLTLNGTETCTGITTATSTVTASGTIPAGTASCNITPGEQAGTYSLTASFAGDTSLPLQLMPANGTANFVVTLEETELSYTGPVTAQNGQPYTLSGVLTTDGNPLGGRAVLMTLGSGTTAQSCTGTTNATGTAACTITVTGQSPGPIPVTAAFASDGYYRMASAASTVNLPEGTQLTVNPTSGTYEGSTPLSGTLVNTYTNQPVPNEPVTFTLNGTQSCTGTTNAQGVATCPVTPNEPQGSYSLSGTFPGDTTSMPQLNPTSSSSTATVTQAPTTFTYTGTTSVTNGQSATLSGVLTSSEPTSGTDVSGKTVTFTLGSGSSLQSCTAVTNTSGAASCTIPNVNQSTGTAGVSASFGGDIYYSSTTASSTAAVHTPTTLTVSAGTSDFADAGTVTGVLTNAVTGAPIPAESVTLTLNGTQSCSAVTNASGTASCSITPNEPAATYTLTGSFGGDTTKAPQLLASIGSNHYVVTLEETAIAYTGPSIAVSGMPFTLSANLSTDGNPLGGRSVLMTLGSGTTAQSCTGATNSSGAASCTIANVNQTAGTAPISVAFAGDAYYRPASASGSVTTASAADTGAFVVGDISAGTPPATLPSLVSNGNQVNFWGAQTWKTNQFSGVNNAPASMKGYIDDAPPNYTCGGTWTSDPGNSSHPPSTVPVNLLVVVSSYINQSGSTESGNIKHVAVVSVAPGYAGDPGHRGYGQIIGWLC